MIQRAIVNGKPGGYCGCQSSGVIWCKMDGQSLDEKTTFEPRDPVAFAIGILERHPVLSLAKHESMRQLAAMVLAVEGK